MSNSDTIKGTASKYKPEYCEMLIDHMTTGRSYDTFARKVGVVRSTLYEWEKAHPEWKNAKDDAFQAAQDFFESKLVMKLDEGNRMAKNIDTTCLIFALKTRFHETYGDKKEVQHTGSQEITLSYKKEK